MSHNESSWIMNDVFKRMKDHQWPKQIRKTTKFPRFEWLRRCESRNWLREHHFRSELSLDPAELPVPEQSIRGLPVGIRFEIEELFDPFPKIKKKWPPLLLHVNFLISRFWLARINHSGFWLVKILKSWIFRNKFAATKNSSGKFSKQHPKNFFKFGTEKLSIF